MGLYVWLCLLLIFLSPSTNVSAETDTDSFGDIKVVKIDYNGDLILTTHTDQKDVYLAKVANNGTKLWSTTFGGSDLDEIIDLLIDSDNNLYVIGNTQSPDFEVLNAFQPENGGMRDYFISKFSSDGDLLWSTYYGGGDEEILNGIFTLTSNQELIFFGFTYSNDFPVSESAFQLGNNGGRDLVISKFSSDGERLWGSYIGSPDEDGGWMRLDNEENIIVYGDAEANGITSSIKSGFEYTGLADPFIVKIGQNGDLVYSLYHGGSGIEYSIFSAIDTQNNFLHLTETQSEDFPTTGSVIQSVKDGGWDLTFSKFSPQGDLQWSSYFGGNGDEGYFGLLPRKIEDKMLLDSSNNIYFKTGTDSTNLDDKFTQVFPNNYGDSQLIGKISSDGDLIYGRYVGGYDMDHHLLNNGELIMAVNLDIDDWEVINASQISSGGGAELGIAKLTANGEIEWSTFLGGSSSDAMLKSIYNGNHLYVMGTTYSSDLPNSVNQYMGNIDIFTCQISSIGSIDWCKYFGTEGRDYTSGGGLVVDPSSNNLYVFVAGISSDNPDTGVLSSVSQSGETIWTNELVPELRVPLEIETDDNLAAIFVTLGVFSALIVGIQGYRVNKIKSSIKLAEMLMNESMSKIISPIFKNQPDLIYLFGLAKQPNSTNLPPGLASDIPKELLDFSYLMHPLRISIVKLLVDAMSLTTVQIKELLDVTWNELHPHLDSLKKKKYVTIDKEFADGQLVNVVRAEPNTIAQYKMLKGLLMEFFDATPNIERYIEQVNEWKKTQAEPDLYPKESNNH